MDVRRIIAAPRSCVRDRTLNHQSNELARNSLPRLLLRWRQLSGANMLDNRHLRRLLAMHRQNEVTILVMSLVIVALTAAWLMIGREPTYPMMAQSRGAGPSLIADSR